MIENNIITEEEINEPKKEATKTTREAKKTRDTKEKIEKKLVAKKQKVEDAPNNVSLNIYINSTHFNSYILFFLFIIIIADGNPTMQLGVK